MWQLSETLGNRTIVPADTLSLNFQNTNLVDGMTGKNNFLGNLGSPRLSRIFFDRESTEPTIFMTPFSSFFVRPDQVFFTNSNVPYTNLTYYKAGIKVNGEERFKSYFSVNVNKRLAFGFNFDYLYGRGYYSNQSTSHFNAGIFGSYIGERYQLQAVYNNFFMKMNENGGIANDGYITRPDTMADGKKEYESTTIRVMLEQTSIRPGLDPLEQRMRQMFALNFNWFMQTLLDRKDRMSMYSGLEVRVPFCDYRIAEYLYSVPWEYKDYEGHEKGLLRQAMQGVLPTEVLWRKKSPYPKTWNPAYLNAVSAMLRSAMQDPDAPLLRIAKRAALEQLLTAAETATPWYGQLMTTPQTIAWFVQLNYWLQKYRVELV